MEKDFENICYCEECGHQISSNAAYCPYCGHPLDKSSGISGLYDSGSSKKETTTIFKLLKDIFSQTKK